MSRGPQSFTQRDVTKALKGAVAAGIAVRRVEVGKDGRIIIVAGPPEGDTVAGGTANEWDSVK